jgi:hypothetical protein
LSGFAAPWPVLFIDLATEPVLFKVLATGPVLQVAKSIPVGFNFVLIHFQLALYQEIPVSEINFKQVNPLDPLVTTSLVHQIQHFA